MHAQGLSIIMNVNIREYVKNFFALIGILATLLGLAYTVIELYDRFSIPNIEIFENDIYLTSTNSNTGLIKFLESNNGKTVYIDNFIDASLVFEENSIVEEQCGIDIDAIVKDNIEKIPIPLPIYENISNLNCFSNNLVLDIGENTVYEPSYGGTGIVTVRFKGFFEISKTYHSGPSNYYHLKEVEVPYEVREKLAL